VLRASALPKRTWSPRLPVCPSVFLSGCGIRPCVAVSIGKLLFRPDFQQQINVDKRGRHRLCDKIDFVGSSIERRDMPKEYRNLLRTVLHKSLERSTQLIKALSGARHDGLPASNTIRLHHGARGLHDHLFAASGQTRPDWRSAKVQADIRTHKPIAEH